jgi:hypothetical protein
MIDLQVKAQERAQDSFSRCAVALAQPYFA